MGDEELFVLGAMQSALSKTCSHLPGFETSSRNVNLNFRASTSSKTLAAFAKKLTELQELLDSAKICYKEVLQVLLYQYFLCHWRSILILSGAIIEPFSGLNLVK